MGTRDAELGAGHRMVVAASNSSSQLQLVDGKYSRVLNGLGTPFNAVSSTTGDSRLVTYFRRSNQPTWFMSDVAGFIFLGLKLALDKAGIETMYWPDLAYVGAYGLGMIIAKKSDDDGFVERASWFMANVLPVMFFALKYVSEKVYGQPADYASMVFAGIWAVYQIVPIFNNYQQAKAMRTAAVNHWLERSQAANDVKNSIMTAYERTESLATVAKFIGVGLISAGAMIVNPSIPLGRQLDHGGVALAGVFFYCLGYFIEERNSKSRAQSASIALSAVPNAGVYRFGFGAALVTGAITAIMAGAKTEAASQEMFGVISAVSILVGGLIFSHAAKAAANQADVDLVIKATGKRADVIDKSNHVYAAGSNVMHHSFVAQSLLLATVTLLMVNRHFSDDVEFMAPGSAVVMILATIAAVNAYVESSKIYATTVATDSVANGFDRDTRAMGQQEWRCNLPFSCCR